MGFGPYFGFHRYYVGGPVPPVQHFMVGGNVGHIADDGGGWGTLGGDGQPTNGFGTQPGNGSNFQDPAVQHSGVPGFGMGAQKGGSMGQWNSFFNAAGHGSNGPGSTVMSAPSHYPQMAGGRPSPGGSGVAGGVGPIGGGGVQYNPYGLNSLNYAQGTQDPGTAGTNMYNVDPNRFNLPGYGQFEQKVNGQANTALGYQPSQSQVQSGMQGQSRLEQMLFDQANGKGPSIAQQQLQQTTQNNLANQFAMAQANANDGGALRNLSNNLGNMNQQAAGQGALLRAQEQQQNMGLLGNVLNQQRGADAGMFQNANQAGLGYLDLGLKGDQSQQAGAMNYSSQAQNAFNNAAAIRRGIAGGVASGAAGALGQLANGVKAGGGSGGNNSGGGDTGGYGSDGPGYADTSGGDGNGLGGTGTIGDNTSAPGYDPGGSSTDPGGGWSPPSYGNVGAGGGYGYSQGGSVLGLHRALHPEQYLNGGGVPGRAKVDGNSPKNDTVPAVLSPGEIVLPRSVTEDSDAAEKAKLFVQAIKKKHGGK